MARFYGSIQGNRGNATRMGTPNSGFTAWAAGWQGRVVIEIDDRDGVDWARVSLAKHHGHGTSQLLYDGPVGGTE